MYLLQDNVVITSVQVINWKLDHIGMNPTAEAYLVLHRFGSVSISTFTLKVTSNDSFTQNNLLFLLYLSQLLHLGLNMEENSSTL